MIITKSFQKFMIAIIESATINSNVYLAEGDVGKNEDSNGG